MFFVPVPSPTNTSHVSYNFNRVIPHQRITPDPWYTVDTPQEPEEEEKRDRA